jgi:PAS domain S-box-containing protein
MLIRRLVVACSEHTEAWEIVVHSPLEMWYSDAVQGMTLVLQGAVGKDLQGKGEEVMDGIGLSSGHLMQELTTLRRRVSELEATDTRHQQTENTLRESEAKFRRLVHESLHGLIVHRQHRPLFINQTFATMLGYATPEEILGLETLLTLVDPQDHERLSAYYSARLRGDDVPSQYEYHAIRKDGTRLLVEVRATIVPWDGAPAVLLTTVDVNTHKQAEAALARYHLLSEQTRDIILFIHMDGRILEANHAAVAAYGYDRETLLTMTIYDLRSPATVPMVSLQMLQADTAGIRFETVHRRQDGGTFPVEVGSIGADLNGERILLSIIRDITDRKQAEDAMRQSQELFAKAFSASPHLISISSMADGRYLMVNDAVLRATGYTRDEIIGHTSTELKIFAEPEGRDKLVQALQKSGTIRDLELHLRGKHGHIQTVLLSAEIITIDGQPCILTSSNDITARRQAEETLQRAYAELEERVEERTAALRQAMAERQRLAQEAQRVQHFALLGRLAAGVSHEIRNPLGVIFLQVDLLEEELQHPTPDSPGQIAQVFSEIKTHLARLDDLVQDYLSLVRVSSLQLEAQDLAAALQTWSAEFQELAAARGVTLLLDGLETVGWAPFHASTLQRALLNLVQNALDAMPEGGTLTLAGQRTATQVQLHIRDTGSGIPAELLARLFEPLYTTKPGGTGLGLYIVQEIIAAHAGQLTVASKEGQGTTFTIALPQTVHEAATRHENPPSALAPSGRG